MRKGSSGLMGMGALLAASVCVTQALLMGEGRWQEAIPLHLCSVSAMVALFVAFGARGTALDFLWYLGLPGAALALLFPSPAASRAQMLFNLSYAVTHLMIVLIPLGVIVRGDLPRPGRTAAMMALLQGLALCAFAVNETLGTDFLFLAAPPAGTPLERLFALGYAAYLLALEGMMLLLCIAQSASARLLPRRIRSVQTRKNAL